MQPAFNLKIHVFEIQARAAGPSASCKNPRSGDEQLVSINRLCIIESFFEAAI